MLKIFATIRFLPLVLLSLCLAKGSWCMDKPDDHNPSESMISKACSAVSSVLLWAAPYQEWAPAVNQKNNILGFSMPPEIQFHILDQSCIYSIYNISEFRHAYTLKLVCKSWNERVTESTIYTKIDVDNELIIPGLKDFRTNKNFRYMGEHTYTFEYRANGWIGETQTIDEYKWPVGIFFEHSNQTDRAPENHIKRYNKEKNILNVPIKWTFEIDNNKNIIWVAKIHTYIQVDNIFSTDTVRFKYYGESIDQNNSIPLYKTVWEAFSWYILSRR